MSNEEFEFSYLAPTEKERAEIEHIQKQYLKNEKNQKLEKLRKLDSKVKNTPTCVALAMGVVGVLVFGTGLAMALEWNLLIAGIIVGAFGCVPMALAYFVYNKLYSKLYAKHSEEIVKLSNELLNKE